jgi:hypothetical protein
MVRERIWIWENKIILLQLIILIKLLIENSGRVMMFNATFNNISVMYAFLNYFYCWCQIIFIESVWNNHSHLLFVSVMLIRDSYSIWGRHVLIVLVVRFTCASNAYHHYIYEFESRSLRCVFATGRWISSGNHFYIDKIINRE